MPDKPRFQKAKTVAISHIWLIPWVQKSTAVIVFIVLAFLHYQLAHLLVSVNLASEECKECNPVKAQLRQVLSISQIISNETYLESPAISWGPIKNVSIHFNKARLDGKLLANLQRFQPNIPTQAQPIDFNTVGDGISQIYITIYLRSQLSLANKLNLTHDLWSQDGQLELKMNPEGIETAVVISQLTDDNNKNTSVGNQLRIGDWHYKLSGIPIVLLPENGTDVLFRFFSIDRLSSENSTVIHAQSVGVTPRENTELARPDSLFCGASESGKILLTEINSFLQHGCRNPKKLFPLELSALTFDRENLQISASGNAWVQIKGKPITIDITALIKNNPYLAALLGIFDALLIAWLKRVFGQK